MLYLEADILITLSLMIVSIIRNWSVKLKRFNIPAYLVFVAIGAVLLVATGKITVSELIREMIFSTGMNPVKILVLFFSMTFISTFLDEAGFFKYMASVVIEKAGDSQKSLFTILFIAISVLTVFTSNDVIILTFTPFICFFCRHSHINPIPYVVSEFVAANTLSMALIIGNPTNIYISLSLGIDFITYFQKMFLIAIAVAIAGYALLYFMFRKELSQSMHKEHIPFSIKDKLVLSVSLITLLCCTVLMAISNFVNISMYTISLLFALALAKLYFIYCLAKKQKPTLLTNTLKRLPYTLIVFLFSMFTLVLACNKYGISAYIATLLNSRFDVVTYGFASFFSCSLINNIPMSVLFSSIISSSSTISTNAIYACVAGSNLGAILSPIGALAGLMWLNLLKENSVKYSFKDFIKNGSIISITLMSLTLALIYVF